jgi:hypothetical protein
MLSMLGRLLSDGEAGECSTGVNGRHGFAMYQAALPGTLRDQDSSADFPSSQLALALSKCWSSSMLASFVATQVVQVQTQTACVVEQPEALATSCPESQKQSTSHFLAIVVLCFCAAFSHATFVPHSRHGS